MRQNRTYGRTDRIAELIRQELGSMLLREIRDPRVQHVNITQVTITRDLSLARVRYLLIGLDAPDSAKGKRALKEAADGLVRATPFIRRELGKRIEMRITPNLEFLWDSGIEHGRKMERIFAEIAEDRQDETPGES